MRSLLLFVVLLAAPGCFISRSAVNDPLAESTLARLEPGRTTAAEVLEILGAPVEVVQLGRRTAYRFDAASTKRAGLWLLLVGFLNDDTRSDRIWVFFDENDVLTHVGATFEARDTRYAMPWQDIHHD